MHRLLPSCAPLSKLSCVHVERISYSELVNRTQSFSQRRRYFSCLHDRTDLADLQRSQCSLHLWISLFSFGSLFSAGSMPPKCLAPLELETSLILKKYSLNFPQILLFSFKKSPERWAEWMIRISSQCVSRDRRRGAWRPDLRCERVPPERDGAVRPRAANKHMLKAVFVIIT